MIEKVRLRAGRRNRGYCHVRPTSLSCSPLIFDGQNFSPISGFVACLGEGVLQFSRHLSKCVRKLFFRIMEPTTVGGTGMHYYL